MAHSPFSGAVPVSKRLLDLVLLLGLLPCVFAAGLIVAVYIKLVSAGPVFYRQQRIGLRGRPFICYKFRSMHPAANPTVHEQHLRQVMATESPLAKMDERGDPRLIPGGWLLRASGLDELPQLWNVLRGEMSLVGPRPCTRYEFDLYRPSQMGRFRVLPGLTGLWQVSGKNKLTFPQMIALDDHYARTRSLRVDLHILLRTIPTVCGLLREAVSRTARKPVLGVMASQPVH